MEKAGARASCAREMVVKQPIAFPPPQEDSLQGVGSGLEYSKQRKLGGGDGAEDSAMGGARVHHGRGGNPN